MIKGVFCGNFSNLIIEFMIQLKLNHYGKSGSNEQLFRPTMAFLRSVHPQSRMHHSYPRPSVLLMNA